IIDSYLWLIIMCYYFYRGYRKHEKINTILFNDFESLDVFGPIEVFGRLKEHFKINFFSQNGGIIKSSQNVPIVTETFTKLEYRNNILLIPGGKGTRELVKDNKYIDILKMFALDSLYILTVCTGSVLFSKTGMLDEKQATSKCG
ncbi:MAG: DJ-1/PfpI family protein, partial [Atribacterota bacterium]